MHNCLQFYMQILYANLYANFIIHDNKIRCLILIMIYVGPNRRKSTTILNFKIIFVLNFLK